MYIDHGGDVRRSRSGKAVVGSTTLFLYPNAVPHRRSRQRLVRETLNILRATGYNKRVSEQSKSCYQGKT